MSLGWNLKPGVVRWPLEKADTAGPRGKLGTDLESGAPWGYSAGFLHLLLLVVGIIVFEKGHGDRWISTLQESLP